MRIPRLYHPGPLQDGAEIRLHRDQATHVQRVLRLASGDAVNLFDGDGNESRGRLVSLARNGVVVAVGEAVSARPESGLRACLLQGICRGPRMDLVIQKATELGVARIAPVSCERSVIRLDAQRGERRLAHWRGVAVAAAEQCGRARLPRIDPPATLDDVMASLTADGIRILLCPTADRGLGSLPVAADDISLLIGPEGGLTDAERAAAREQGFEEYALGPRILRTETAALTALALLQFLRGDLDGS
jgi:16S rRNA (uracil1498-N3)-methyltransferase